MKKNVVVALTFFVILSLSYFLIASQMHSKKEEAKTSTITKVDQLSSQITRGTSTSPDTNANIKSTPENRAKITYFDICKEKSKKYAQFYFVNDKECRLLYSNDFKTLENYDKVFGSYDALYKAEVASKVNSSLINESVVIKSFYKKGNSFFADFQTDTRISLYNDCESKGKRYTKKDIFGNQANYICNGEVYEVTTDFPVITREVSGNAVINFIGSSASGRSDLFSLSPEEYAAILPRYEGDGMNMQIYIKDNVIVSIVESLLQ